MKQNVSGCFLSSFFEGLRSTHHLKFKEKNVICTQKHFLVQKCLQMSQTSVFHYEPESKRQSIQWKSTDSPVKKRFRVLWLIKYVMRTVFKDMKGLVTLDFLKKGTTVNNASNYQLGRKYSPYFFKDSRIYHHHHVVPSARISLTLSATLLYRLSLLVGLQGYILYRHRAVVCRF